MKTEDVAFNLLAEKTCDTCKGCANRSNLNTCEEWEKYLDGHIILMNKIRAATSQISNNISRGSPNYMVVSAQTAEALKHEITQVLHSQIPEIMSSKVSVSENGVNVMIKTSPVAEYVEINFEVKNEDKSIPE